VVFNFLYYYYILVVPQSGVGQLILVDHQAVCRRVLGVVHLQAGCR
jgi:hypothetical protein